MLLYDSFTIALRYSVKLPCSQFALASKRENEITDRLATLSGSSFYFGNLISLCRKKFKLRFIKEIFRKTYESILLINIPLFQAIFQRGAVGRGLTTHEGRFNAVGSYTIKDKVTNHTI